MMTYLNNLWDLFIDMSFYMVIGLIFTGILHSFVNKDVILKHIGKKDTSSVVKASIFGVPLPLCSCGVVPPAMYLGKSGASKGAVVSFLTSTPQTGVDSIIATYGLMGPLFAVYRAVAAFISGIISGVMTNIFCKNDKADFENAKTSCGCGCEEEPVVETACGCGCTPEPVVETACGCGCTPEPVVETACGCGCTPEPVVETACGCGCEETKPKGDSFSSKFFGIFTYSFGEFLDEIAKHFVVGLLIAALISTLVPEELLSNFTNPLASMILMLIIGIPMYICSTASIPIALTLMMKGISPGSAFVFLFAGPVTNIASLAILAKSLGKKVLTIYLASVAVCAVGFGLILDYIINVTNYHGISDMMAHGHEHSAPIYMVVVAVIFGIFVLRSILKGLVGKKKSASCCA